MAITSKLKGQKKELQQNMKNLEFTLQFLSFVLQVILNLRTFKEPQTMRGYEDMNRAGRRIREHEYSR